MPLTEPACILTDVVGVEADVGVQVALSRPDNKLAPAVMAIGVKAMLLPLYTEVLVSSQPGLWSPLKVQFASVVPSNLQLRLIWYDPDIKPSSPSNPLTAAQSASWYMKGPWVIVT